MNPYARLEALFEGAAEWVRHFRRRPVIPRIGYLAESLDDPDTCQRLGGLARGLPRELFQSSVILLEERPGSATEGTPELGWAELCAPEPGLQAMETLRHAGRIAPALRQPEMLLRSAWPLSRLLRRREIDVLHTHGWPVYWVGLAAAKLAGVPYVVHTELGGDLPEGPGALSLLRLAARATDRFLVGCSGSPLELRGELPPQRLMMVPPGVNVSAFCPRSSEGRRQELGIPAGRLVVGSITRTPAEDGASLLLDAGAVALEDGVDLELLLICSAEAQESLRRRAAELHLDGRVHLISQGGTVGEPWAREHPTSLLGAMDAFVVPHGMEYLPHSVLEAMAMALPVVAVSEGRTPELIRDGDTGLLVPPNHPRLVARIIQELATSPERRRALGERARARVLKLHAEEQVVAVHLALYREMLGPAAL